MTGVLIVGGSVASASLGCVLCRIGYRDRIRELEQALASSREFCRDLARRQLRMALRPSQAPVLHSAVPDWPAPDPATRTMGPYEQPAVEPLRPLDVDPPGANPPFPPESSTESPVLDQTETRILPFASTPWRAPV